VISISSDPTDPQKADTNAGALERIVAGLYTHPPLLYGLGGAIVLAGLAGVVAGEAWLLIVAVVLVLVAALAAWFASDRAARAARGGGDFDPRARVRDYEAGEGAAVQSRRGGGLVGRFRPRFKARDVKLGRGSRFQSLDDEESGRPQDRPAE
jgi:hypothetical protein